MDDESLRAWARDHAPAGSSLAAGLLRLLARHERLMSRLAADREEWHRAEADRDHYRDLSRRLADRLADASEALSRVAERGRADRFAETKARLLAAMGEDIEQLRKIVRGKPCP